MAKYHTIKEMRQLKRKGEANRLKSIGALVADALRQHLNVADVTEGTTTSGAPLIQMLTYDGLRFNVTVTKARSKRCTQSK